MKRHLPMWILCALVLPLRTSWGETLAPAAMAFAPNVPPAIKRSAPATVRVELETLEQEGVLMKGLGQDTKYTFWTYNGHVPGPFIRSRVGDTLEVHLKNPKTSTMPHDVDLHAVTGPGGGAALTLAGPGEEKVARFKLLNPGLYIYHCAAPPVSTHIAMGMYGLILVEPEGGLSPVDREFYVVQSEFYTKGEFGDEGLQSYDIVKAMDERPTYVVFNGQVGALKDDGVLKAKTNDRIRIFFGDAGPNLISSFHLIGAIFDKVYHEGSTANPERNVQTTVVPAGGAAMVEFQTPVPGNFTLVDHSIFRIDKGAIGILHVDGAERPDLYQKRP